MALCTKRRSWCAFAGGLYTHALESLIVMSLDDDDGGDDDDHDDDGSFNNPTQAGRVLLFCEVLPSKTSQLPNALDCTPPEQARINQKTLGFPWRPVLLIPSGQV